MRSRTHDRGQKFADRGNPVLSQEVVKLLKTQDAGYLKTTAQKTRRAREKLEHEFVLRDGRGAEVLGDEVDREHQQHIVFMESRDQQKQFDPKDYFATTEDGLDRRFNRPKIRPVDPEEEENEEQNIASKVEGRSDDWTARRIARRGALVLKAARMLRKQHKREQEARRSRLKALKMKEKDLIAVEQELELQRAKMSNSVGGVTKTGVKWKVRERKK